MQRAKYTAEILHCGTAASAAVARVVSVPPAQVPVSKRSFALHVFECLPQIHFPSIYFSVL
jgi:hypothetical protein